ncbi:xylulokinase [Nocardioides donggukensis]|uniref:Xylulose kinase n=1 Tax=Nocardioides donggukensis TaxID=2774019 RepID=A0A927Q2I1_9ACTN|nr:xylulokinase [Nocardioides donggukensis]MBD8870419.1 xylulokinase [Nocardioides donggukensis]
MTLVAGVDSSTQSCKVVVCDADTGEVQRSAALPHPEGSEVDPAAWWTAWEGASAGLLDGVAALSVAGQQHGMVALDAEGASVRPALLWNDTRSAPQAAELIDELGGAGEWAQAVGTVPVASLTVTKLRWLAEHEPGPAGRTERVMLPHDWLTWCLTGRGEAVTDRGDASGTGYWSPATGEYRTDLLERAFGRTLEVPRVVPSPAVVGETATGIQVAPGTGDNMAAALGLQLQPGDVVVSLGTSGVVFAISEAPSADPTGIIAGFADATHRFLPLVCTMNCARVLGAAATMLGTDLTGLSDLALAARPGADGLTLLPYLDGERTPNLPTATGTLVGLTRQSMTPENLARAAVEGMLCGLTDGLDALRASGVRVDRVLLTGGAAQSPAVRAIAPLLFGVPVSAPPTAEYVALGAARQAAWAATGHLPEWPREDQPCTGGQDTVDSPAPGDSGVRSRYAEARLARHGL